MNNVMQFVGLILFLSFPGGMIVEIPDYSKEIPKHDAFLAVPRGTADFSGWGTGKPDGTFDNNGTTWEYVTLSGGIQLQLRNAEGSIPSPAPSLPHLKSGCCQTMVLNNTFPRTATMTIENGSVSCAVDGKRIDTVLNFTSQRGIEISTTDGKTLKFSGGATVVAGNYPLGDLDPNLPPPTPSPMNHFPDYYKLGSNSSGCTNVPSTSSACAGKTKCTSGLKSLVVSLNRLSLAQTSQNQLAPKKEKGNVSIMLGPEIDCSNSQYP
jgi:hypothetical protein